MGGVLTGTAKKHEAGPFTMRAAAAGGMPAGMRPGMRADKGAPEGGEGGEGAACPLHPQQPLVGMAYALEVFGCQMNESDAERIAGLLESRGCIPADGPERADLVVFVTCCVREKADTRLYGRVSSIKNMPAAHAARPRIIAVGGCIGQRDGERLRAQLPHVDVVFGTHNISELPDLVCRRIETGEAVAQTVDDAPAAEGADAPARRAKSWHAWLPIMKGCDNFCTYCIVPHVRGRESSRPIEALSFELGKLAAEGVQEVTLLGQNVNSYGRDLYGAPRFAELLHMAGESGIPRVRFVTSHPKDLSPETIEALSAHDNIMPQLHLPVQSGSDAVLAKMNRGYTARRYLDLVEDLRAAVPGIALSTDVIVGFPTETDEDFRATYELVREVGYAQVFTFIYSKRAGTPAAEMEPVCTRGQVQERFDALVELVQQGAWAANQAEADTVVPVLFEGVSKRDACMLAGKSPKNQTVHVPLPQGRRPAEFAGRILDVHIERARTWYLQGKLVS